MSLIEIACASCTRDLMIFSSKDNPRISNGSSFIFFILSILALFNRINPPWLFISIWFFLHPLLMFIYFATKFTLYYPPYRWSLQSWSIITTFLWLYQSLFFIYHSIIHGFLSVLSIVD